MDFTCTYRESWLGKVKLDLNFLQVLGCQIESLVQGHPYCSFIYEQEDFV